MGVERDQKKYVKSDERRVLSQENNATRDP